MCNSSSVLKCIACKLLQETQAERDSLQHRLSFQTERVTRLEQQKDTLERELAERTEAMQVGQYRSWNSDWV